MQQRLTHQMRAQQVNPGGRINLADQQGSTDPGWTLGASLIDTLPLSPPLTQTWMVLGWAFSFNGARFVPAPGLHPSYGKLGSLWAGLLTETVPQTQYPSAPTVPYVVPMLPLPADLSTFEKVWDGTVDPVFPDRLASQAVSGGASLNLPSPIAVDPGAPLSFGLWLTPSLVSDVLLWIRDATISILYDDGIKSP
jgi:hypothetical protein